MCGICGATGPNASTQVSRMIPVLSHRGPDAQGTWNGPGITIGHTRLSIIDLATGDQPMAYANGSLRISYNGEIYNYRRLRDRLRGRGHTFITHSDTEVILASYAEWGPKCVDELIGMFAFAIWDQHQRVLFLARDRLGIKPLYFVESDGELAFASEAKALLARSPQRPSVDPLSVHQALNYRYVRGDASMFQGLKRLPPAHVAEWRDGRLTISRYWSLPAASPDASNPRAELPRVMQEVVTDHLESDVAVSAFVSGGLDSTALAAWALESGSRQMDAFCMDFGTTHDEGGHAATASEALGLTFHPVRMTPNDFGRLREVAWHLDEPIADAITVATFILAEHAARHTKVVLSGEGADEVFAGYIHLRAIRSGDLLHGRHGWAAVAVARAFARILPGSLLEAAFPYPGRLGVSGRQMVHRILAGLRDPVATYRTLTQMFTQDERRDLYTEDFYAATMAYESAETERTRQLMAKSTSGLAGAMRLDAEDWLPNYTLHRLDRLLMAHGIEGRVPYVDHRVVEYALRLPPRALVSPLREKLALRSAAPTSIRRWANRPKQAFTVPLDDPAFGRAGHQAIGALLDDTIDADRGYFRREKLTAIAAGSTGDLLGSKRAMALAMLEAWHQVFVDPATLQHPA